MAGRFLVAGEAIDADLHLDGLPAAPADLPVTCTVRQADSPLATDEVAWLNDPEPGYLRVGWAGPTFVLELDGLVQVVLPPGATDVRWWAPGADEALVAHLVLDHALPHRLSLRGELVLHGTCVAVGDRAVAFCGPSGAGKSTLAAAFATAGHPILADDCLLVRPGPDGPVVVPTYAGTRLRDDVLAAVALEPLGHGTTGTGKRPVTGARRPELFRSTPARLVLLVFLDRGDPDAPLTVTPAPPGPALIELLQQSFIADRGTREGGARTFHQLGDLFDAVPLVRLGYPGDLGRLPQVVAAVVARLGAP